MEQPLAHAPIALDPRQARIVLDALGGTYAVSGLTFTSSSTVHSWRDNGMSKARFDHVCLAAQARGKADKLAAALGAIAEQPPLPFDADNAIANQAPIGSAPSVASAEVVEP